jgi:hypothetical protein
MLGRYQLTNHILFLSRIYLVPFVRFLWLSMFLLSNISINKQEKYVAFSININRQFHSFASKCASVVSNDGLTYSWNRNFFETLSVRRAS